MSISINCSLPINTILPTAVSDLQTRVSVSEATAAMSDTVTLSNNALAMLNNSVNFADEIVGSVNSENAIGVTSNYSDLITYGLSNEQSATYEQDVTLADGREVLQLGDVDSSQGYVHKQGQNDLNFRGDCGMVACGDVLTQFGLDVTENDIVHYALNHNIGKTEGEPDTMGATTVTQQEAILDGLGVPSHVEFGNTLEGLSAALKDGHSAIIEVNAGDLWNRPEYYDSGKTNHAITLTGVAIDPLSGKATGCWIDDSGAGNYKQYLSADSAVIQDWIKADTPSVVTDVEH